MLTCVSTADVANGMSAYSFNPQPFRSSKYRLTSKDVFPYPADPVNPSRQRCDRLRCNIGWTVLEQPTKFPNKPCRCCLTSQTYTREMLHAELIDACPCYTLRPRSGTPRAGHVQATFRHAGHAQANTRLISRGKGLLELDSAVCVHNCSPRISALRLT